jgi:N-acetylglutamate synthase-like GNAT family acetyltransferase
MHNIYIRKAELSDSQSTRKLLSQLGYEVTLSDLEGSLESNTRDDEIYVAQMASQVIGLMTVIYFDYFPTQKKICRITSIVVDECAQGKGVGTKLIDFAKKLSLSHCCSHLEVTTALARESTQKYYENIGFAKTSFRYVQGIGN